MISVIFILRDNEIILPRVEAVTVFLFCFIWDDRRVLRSVTIEIPRKNERRYRDTRAGGD